MLFSRISWRLAACLGTLALVRPVTRIVEDRAGIENHPAVPIALTIGITVAWALAAGLSRIPEPLSTLVASGLVYGVLSVLLSVIASPLLLGHLEGPLGRPMSIPFVLLNDAVWGLLAGALALLIRRRSRRDRSSRHR